MTYDRVDIITRLCEAIVEPCTTKYALKAIAPKLSRVTLWRWLEDDEALRTMFDRARVVQAHAFAEQAIEVANGDDEQAAGAYEALEQAEDELIKLETPGWRSILNKYENAIVQRDKLRVETLKWTAGVLAPKLYGAKVEVDNKGEIGLKHTVGRVALYLPDNSRDPSLRVNDPTTVTILGVSAGLSEQGAPSPAQPTQREEQAAA